MNLTPLIQATLKTAVTGAVGIVGPLVMSAAAHPTGGMAAALASNPMYALVWAGATLYGHNVWDHLFGTAPKKG